MKRFVFFLLSVVATVAAMAQTLNVEVGCVTYQFPAAEAGKMLYADGSSLVILNKVFSLAEVTRMYVDASEVEASTVSVEYSGTQAAVKVAGDIAQYVEAEVSGAHVSVTQSDEVADEITYSLSGASSDG